MKIVNVHEAKTNLSKLLDRAAHGEEIIIGKSGKPVARLTAFDTNDKPRPLGLWKGKVKIAKDFDQLPKGLLKAFGGHSL